LPISFQFLISISCNQISPSPGKFGFSGEWVPTYQTLPSSSKNISGSIPGAPSKTCGSDQGPSGFLAVIMKLTKSVQREIYDGKMVKK